MMSYNFSEKPELGHLTKGEGERDRWGPEPVAKV